MINQSRENDLVYWWQITPYHLYKQTEMSANSLGLSGNAQTSITLPVRWILHCTVLHCTALHCNSMIVSYIFSSYHTRLYSKKAFLLNSPRHPANAAGNNLIHLHLSSFRTKDLYMISASATLKQSATSFFHNLLNYIVSMFTSLVIKSCIKIQNEMDIY